MSTLGYSYSRRYTPHSVPFMNYEPADPNDCLTLSQATRLNSRCYPVGGPVGGSRVRSNYGHDETLVEHSTSRRRIAVACARCRKRKIRCSGDSPDGSGCTNCKQAGLPPNQCLFHRVGSDHVQKIVDLHNLAQGLNTLANSNATYPMYTEASSNAVYNRPTPSHAEQLDMKYHSNWIDPGGENISPTDGLNMDQQGTYAQTPNSVLVSNACIEPIRCDYVTKKAPDYMGNPYYTPLPPYFTHETSQSVTNSDPYSSMNMTSLQMTLPDRPHPRSLVGDRTYQRQLLPIPQPSSNQSSRNAVDQLQQQRLRSAQVTNTSSAGSTSAYNKSQGPWGGENNRLIVSGTQPSDASLQVSSPGDDNLSYPVVSSPIETLSNAVPTGQFDLNFSTSPLLDTFMASSQRITYSNIRESGAPNAQTNDGVDETHGLSMYGFKSDKASNNKNRCEDTSPSTLVSGQHYSPLSNHRSLEFGTNVKASKETPINGRELTHRSSFNTSSARV